MVVFRQPLSAEGRDPLLNDQPPHGSGQELANGANSGERPSCAMRKTTPASKIEVNVWDHAQQATKGCVSHHVDVPSLAVVHSQGRPGYQVRLDPEIGEYRPGPCQTAIHALRISDLHGS